MTDFDITFLGTGGTAPSADRGMPATLFKRGGTKLLVDCGEGTQRQIWKAEGGLVDLDAIFLTHYHSDHILGLPGLLNSYQLRGRETPLPIYGPKPLEANLKRFASLMGQKTFELIEPHEVKPGTVVLFESGELQVVAFRVYHARSQAVGYKLREKDRPGRFSVAQAKHLGLRPGPDFGKLQAGHVVNGVTPEQVIGPPRPGRSVVITGDTAPCPNVKDNARGADLLIHEASLSADLGASDHEHSSALDAAKIARDAQVNRLALYHISRQRPAKFVLQEAWREFMGATVPDDLERISIPLA